MSDMRINAVTHQGGVGIRPGKRGEVAAEGACPSHTDNATQDKQKSSSYIHWQVTVFCMPYEAQDQDGGKQETLRQYPPSPAFEKRMGPHWRLMMPRIMHDSTLL